MQTTQDRAYTEQRDDPRASESGPALKKKKSRRATDTSNQKRKCISTACIACRKRKSKCDGAVPSCAACASVYGTECIYDPNSDHRRKGVYREKTDGMKADDATLKILVEAILNASEDDVGDIVHRIRNCDSLDNLAQQIISDDLESEELSREQSDDENWPSQVDGERDLAGKMGELRIENGTIRFIGGTSHLIYLGGASPGHDAEPDSVNQLSSTNPARSWTDATNDVGLITHLMNMYFNYHYPYFTTLSRKLFWRDFAKGRGTIGQSSSHCSSLLVNAMLALGCHFTDVAGAYATPGDNRTKGDHFFAEAKRLIMEGDEFERPRLVTVQALALMSVREAGCAREATGWVYSGMSFRMAQDIGLNLEMSASDKKVMSDEEIDARRITFWGCFNFDKCWSNYLGRMPQLPKSTFTVAKFDVFPDEDASTWMPLTDKGFDESVRQPSRTRAAALHLASLCEISSDLLLFFYHPNHIHRSAGGKTVELKKLSELHKRLEEWRKHLPKEFEPSDHQLPNVILMHMFFHLQFIHLFRPFLKYAPISSPLPSHISPRRICTSNAGAISKLMRLYKKNWNLRQICNIAVYMTHSACTIHLLNLPEKTAKRDFTHGIKHLEEISEDWLCARRALSILSVLARKWKCALPDEAAQILQRADELYGYYSTSEVPSPKSSSGLSPPASLDDAAATQVHLQSLHFQQGPPSSRVQFAQPSMAQAAAPQASISARLDMNSHHMNPQQQQQQQQQQNQQNQQNQQRQNQPQQGPGIKTQHISYAPGTLDSWGQPMVAISPATAVYPPTSAASLGSTRESIQDFSGARMAPGGLPTGQGAGLDNNQWILNDSAKWQHNFNGWDLGQSLPGAMQFAFPSQQAMALNTNPAASVAEAAAANIHTIGQQPSGLEAFDASMNDARWLPHLE